MIDIPYELELALGKIINHETSLEYEIREIIFLLYQNEKLTWEEIKERSIITSQSEYALREAISGLWVIGFLEQDDKGNIIKRYELSLFGRRLLKNMLEALFIVESEKR